MARSYEAAKNFEDTGINSTTLDGFNSTDFCSCIKIPSDGQWYRVMKQDGIGSMKSFIVENMTCAFYISASDTCDSSCYVSGSETTHMDLIDVGYRFTDPDSIEVSVRNNTVTEIQVMGVEYTEPEIVVTPFLVGKFFFWSKQELDPSDFAPVSHGHVIGDVQGLQDALNTKPTGSWTFDGTRLDITIP